jgi:hypothetical protein
MSVNCEVGNGFPLMKECTDKRVPHVSVWNMLLHSEDCKHSRNREYPIWRPPNRVILLQASVV